MTRDTRLTANGGWVSTSEAVPLDLPDNRIVSAARWEPDIQKMAERLARYRITDNKVLWLARRAYKSTPWAGHPIPWEETTDRHRQQYLDDARALLTAIARPGEGGIITPTEGATS